MRIYTVEIMSLLKSRLFFPLCLPSQRGKQHSFTAPARPINSPSSTKQVQDQTRIFLVVWLKGEKKGKI